MTKLKEWQRSFCVLAYHQRDEEKSYINGRISKTSLALFLAGFCFVNEARGLEGE